MSIMEGDEGMDRQKYKELLLFSKGETEKLGHRKNWDTEKFGREKKGGTENTQKFLEI